MNGLKLFLIASTVMIYGVTVLAVQAEGFFWPAVYFGDLAEFNWRTQFNADFLVHLFLLATWISWREGFTPKGFLLGFLSIFMGGMVGFPYILWAIIKSGGDPKKTLLGVHA